MTVFARAGVLFLALVPLMLASAGRPVTGAAGSGKDPKLDSHIAALLDARAGSGTAAKPATALNAPGGMRFDASGRLSVFVYARDTLARTADAVASVGGLVLASSDAVGAVQASVPLAGLRALAADPAVRYVGLPRYPLLNAGARTTEGDEILAADQVRSLHGVDGSGVRLGVISDGIYEFQKSQASGDLPPLIDYTTCNAAPSFDPTTALAGGEGTAILEIVHDLAPGAELWFASFGFASAQHGTEIDFMNAVNCLAQHVDVIVDDISWFGVGPYDGTSAVSTNTSDQLNDPSKPLRLYATSVGNWAQRHYAETYTPCGTNNLHLFRATEKTIDATGAGVRCSNPVVVGPFSTAQVSLVWDDPFGASCNDYDLIVTEHDSTTELASSRDPQTCTQDPVEAVTWTNSTFAAVTVDVVIENVSGLAEPRDFDMFVGAATLGYYTPAGSVPNQGDAGGGVISVGAIGAADPGADDIQPYSSRGPTRDGRMKPDVAAIDCVVVTGNGYPPPFCGTSASAPHIAGIAALLLECNPNLLAADQGGSAALDRQQLAAAILQTADERGDPGPDNTYGAGLANALEAAEAICSDSAGLLGDVDCNSAVDAVDALFILRKVASVEPDAACLHLGDVNCDLALDAVDALWVLRHVAGIPLPPPDGCRPTGT